MNEKYIDCIQTKSNFVDDILFLNDGRSSKYKIIEDFQR